MPLDSWIPPASFKQGARCKGWRDAAADSVVDRLSEGPVPGPRAAPYGMNYLDKTQRGAADRDLLFSSLPKWPLDPLVLLREDVKEEAELTKALRLVREERKNHNKGMKNNKEEG